MALIDVRDPERFEAGPPPGRGQRALGESARDAHDPPTSRRSRSAGARAGRIASSWSAARATAPRGPPTRSPTSTGSTNVASMIGGAKLWSELGYPIEGEITVGDEEAETHLEGEEDTT